MLDITNYLVKERVGFMKLVDVFDIYNADTGEKIGVAIERPSGLVKALRLLINKRFMPTRVDIGPSENEPPYVSIRRGITFLRSKIMIIGKGGTSLGYFKSKLFSLGGGFFVYNDNDEQVAEIKGDWKGWNFKFLSASGEEIGLVTKKWAGIGKELFTSADNYVISLSGEPDETRAALLLAAGIAIDTVFKEK